jgi:hypothetical protein
MKRFIKEYANYRLANNPFLYNSVCGQFYNRRIQNALHNCERGFISINEAMNIIANAEQYAMDECKPQKYKGMGTELVKEYLGKRTV